MFKQVPMLIILMAIGCGDGKFKEEMNVDITNGVSSGLNDNGSEKTDEKASGNKDGSSTEKGDLLHPKHTVIDYKLIISPESEKPEVLAGQLNKNQFDVFENNISFTSDMSRSTSDLAMYFYIKKRDESLEFKQASLLAADGSKLFPEMDVSVDKKSGKISIYLLSFKDYLEEDILRVNLEIGKEEKAIELSFRDIPRISMNNKVSDKRLKFLSSNKSEIEIKGTPYKLLSAVDLKNVSKEKINLLFSLSNKDRKVTAKRRVVSVQSKSCSHSSTSKEMIKKEEPFLLLPISKNFVTSMAAINTKRQIKYSVDIESKELLAVGIYVKSKHYREFKGIRTGEIVSRHFAPKKCDIKMCEGKRLPTKDSRRPGKVTFKHNYLYRQFKTILEGQVGGKTIIDLKNAFSFKYDIENKEKSNELIGSKITLNEVKFSPSKNFHPRPAKEINKDKPKGCYECTTIEPPFSDPIRRYRTRPC